MVEIQAIMRHYNKAEGRVHLVDYAAFVNGLRLPLEGRRLNIVRLAFSKINPEAGAEAITVGQARGCFAYEQFEKWCQAIEVGETDDEVVTWDKFCEFYADISMTIFKDEEFIGLVSSTWSVDEQSYMQVGQKEVERFIAAIRHNLQKYGNHRHTEEFLLRELFRDFDRQNTGFLSINELREMLFKINLSADERYMEALLNKFEQREPGLVEFDEF